MQTPEQYLERDRNNVLGRAQYKGRGYYLVGQGSSQHGPWCRLMFRDGSKTFFANASLVEITATYQQARTLSGLQKYAEEAREAAAEDRGIRSRNGCECDCQDCNGHCRCDSHCNCRGGNIYDC
jgi:hypothetical protein